MSTLPRNCQIAATGRLSPVISDRPRPTHGPASGDWFKARDMSPEELAAAGIPTTGSK
ncbi:MAG: hypothetical protein IT579_01565 [Verrucomicrobia subdivision 3 bacterium]|nr:hypothetical protein [Limisphaerales bacterium]